MIWRKHRQETLAVSSIFWALISRVLLILHVCLHPGEFWLLINMLLHFNILLCDFLEHLVKFLVQFYVIGVICWLSSIVWAYISSLPSIGTSGLQHLHSLLHHHALRSAGTAEWVHRLVWLNTLAYWFKILGNALLNSFVSSTMRLSLQFRCLDLGCLSLHWIRRCNWPRQVLMDHLRW